MRSKGKIASVLELAKYKVGDILYWVIFRPVGAAGITIPPGEEWMMHAHPKVIHDRGLAKKIWKNRALLPKLCSVDFQYVVEVLTTEPVVESFEISRICRSFDTGEYYYANEEGEWMPEKYLFTAVSAAKREKKRIKDLFKKWAMQASPDEV